MAIPHFSALRSACVCAELQCKVSCADLNFHKNKKVPHLSLLHCCCCCCVCLLNFLSHVTNKSFVLFYHFLQCVLVNDQVKMKQVAGENESLFEKFPAGHNVTLHCIVVTLSLTWNSTDNKNCRNRSGAMLFIVTF